MTTGLSFSFSPSQKALQIFSEGVQFRRRIVWANISHQGKKETKRTKITSSLLVSLVITEVVTLALVKSITFTDLSGPLTKENGSKTIIKHAKAIKQFND